ncbi:MAG TPA: PEP-CTERM sorting domain-containing protein [Myxococcota bacterium]
MRQYTRSFALLIAFALLGVAGVAHAEKLAYYGTHTLEFSNLGKISFTVEGVGVADVVRSAEGHLTTLQLTQHFPGGRMNTVIPITDPAVAAIIPSVHITSLRINPQVQGGIFAPISGGGATPLTRATMPLTGTIRICLFYAGCNSGAITQTLGQQTTSGAYTGVGVGGTFSINPGGTGGIRISIYGAPWTVGTASVMNITDSGAITTLTAMGFAHGPASLTSSTARPGGVLQLVTASQVIATGIPGSPAPGGEPSGQINTLRLEFIPEPGVLLLLGSGAAGMALLGRKRLKR